MKTKFEKLKKFSESKTFLVIFSVLCGIIAWLLVLDANNPTVERTISVEVQFMNYEEPAQKNLTLVSDLGVISADIKISGREDIVNNVTPADISLAVDFSQVDKAGSSYLSLNKPVCEKIGVTVEDYYPKGIEVTYDTRTEMYLPVRINYSAAMLAPGYEIVSVLAEPDRIPMSGFASDIENLDYVKVDLEESVVSGSVDSDKTIRLIGRFISNTGNDVTANFDTEKITVDVDVAKRIPVRYKISGEPGEDRYLGETFISHETVLVDGGSAELSAITEIDLGTIDISDVLEDTFISFNVADYLPETLYALGTSKITVTADIEELVTKEITVPKETVSYAGRYDNLFEYDIEFNRQIVNENGDIVLTVKGREGDVENVTPSSLSPTVTLEDEAGDYRFKAILMSVPENVVILDEYKYWANISISPVATPEATESPDDSLTEAPENDATDFPAEETPDAETETPAVETEATATAEPV